jgi:hypothetical protein
MEMIKHSFAGDHQVRHKQPRCKNTGASLIRILPIQITYMKPSSGVLNSGNVKRTDTV